jgi:chromosome segregation ATPase
MTKEAEAKYLAREKEYINMAKEYETTKNELEIKTEDYKKLKSESDTYAASLEVYRQPKTSVCEELLGQLHEFVSEATKDIEMSELQEEEYQRIMGALDQTIKNVENQKAEAAKEAHGYKNTVNGLEMQNEDLAERLKRLEEQNKVLKEQSREATQKLEKTKQVEEEEWNKLQSRLAELEQAVIDKSHEVSKHKDLLKHANEDHEELKTKFESNHAECLALARQLTDLQSKQSTLETKYKLLKEKYSESRDGNMRKYEARIRAKEKELESIMERKYKQKYEPDESEPTTMTTTTPDEIAKQSENQSEDEHASSHDGYKTPASQDNGAPLSHPLVSREDHESSLMKLKLVERENQELKKEIGDVLSEKSALEQQIEELTSQIQASLKQKKLMQTETQVGAGGPANGIAGSQGLASQAAGSSGSNKLAGSGSRTDRVALNTKRVATFVTSVDGTIRNIYKQFIVWGTNKTVDITKIDGLQKDMNDVLELVDDFKEYVTSKQNN